MTVRNVQLLQKRGVRAPVSDEIEVGEVAINTAAGHLYVKTDEGDVVRIGGDGTAKDGNQNVDGGGASSIYLLDQVINGGSA